MGSGFLKAQGSLEYLVIVGSVVVVSLVVVGLVLSQTGSSESVVVNSSRISSLVGDWSLVEVVVDRDGNGVLVVQNNTGETSSIDSFLVDGAPHYFGGVSVASGSRVGFDLNGLSGCLGEKRSYSLGLVYVTSDGLVKRKDFGSVLVSCVPVAVAVGNVVSEGGGVVVPPVVDDVPPVVRLALPVDGAIVSGSLVDFSFWVSDANSIGSCRLRLNGVDVNVVNSPVKDVNIVLRATVSVGSSSWDVNCVDVAGNSALSGSPRSIIYSLPVQLKSNYFWSDVNFSPSTGFFSLARLKGNNGGFSFLGERDWNASANYTYNSVDYNRDMNGLVAYYKFNEKIGSTIIDYAGYDNNGTLMNGADNNAQGLWDTNAGYFDGVNDYVSVAHANQINITGPFSVSLWVYFVSVNNTEQALAVKGATPSKWANYGLASSYSSGRANIQFWSGDGINPSGRYITTTTPLETGRWYHVLGVISGSGTNEAKIYVNGVLAAQGTLSLPTSTTEPLLIGAWRTGYYLGNSYIDEVKLWNRALSFSEIQADYNRWFSDSNYVSPIIDTGSALTDYNYLVFNSNNGLDRNGRIYGSQIEPSIEKDLNVGLVGLWHLNGNALDYSGNGHNGTWFGTESFTSGVFSQAGSFNGSSRISCGSGMPTGSVSRTISAWIKPAGSGTRSIAGWGNDSSANLSEMRLLSDNKLQFHGYGADIASSDSVMNNQWSFVAITYASGILRLYINGQYSGQGSFSLNTTSVNCSIGRQPDYVGEYFNGQIDEVAIWSRALSANEIKELFNKGASRLGVKYRSCVDSSCSANPSWSDLNYSAGTQINLSNLAKNRYFQYSVHPILNRFPDGNYLPNAYPTFRDLNLVYTN